MRYKSSFHKVNVSTCGGKATFATSTIQSVKALDADSPEYQNLILEYYSKS